MSRKLNLVGKKFGRLTAVEPTEKRQANGSIHWKCECECGEFKITSAACLQKGETTSCGCEKFRTRSVDLTGKRFGRLLVTEVTRQRRRGAVLWKCLCDCGTEVITDSYNLSSGQSKSCSCLQKEAAKSLQYKHGLSTDKKFRLGYTRKAQAAKLQRTPPWSDLDAVQKIYADCPDGYHVDHQIPLQGQLVSGLHVPANLQYLTSKENCSKGNKFTPYLS